MATSATDLRDWNPGHTNPDASGMFERDATGRGELTDIIYSHFDGLYWRIGDGFRDTPVSETISGNQDLPWREPI